MEKMMEIIAKISFCRFIGNTKGAALIEFAIILPLLVVFYFGTVEVTEAIIAKRRLNLAVTTIGDLASQAQQVQQVQTITSSDATSIFGAGSAIMGSLKGSGLRMRLTSLIVYPTGVGCVDWSIGNNMPSLTAGASYAVPTILRNSSSASPRDFIVAEGNMDFTPFTQNVVLGSITLREGPTFIVPRATNRVLVDTTVQTPAAKCA